MSDWAAFSAKACGDISTAVAEAAKGNESIITDANILDRFIAGSPPTLTTVFLSSGRRHFVR
jgi:hypothetical protein